MAKGTINPQQFGKAKSKAALAGIFRGQIIQKFTDLEMLIEVAIAYYFCDTKIKRDQLLHRILCADRMDFEVKRNTLGFIIHNNYKEFGMAHPTFIGDLLKLQQLRNILAHRKVLNTNEKIDSFNLRDIEFENFTTEKNSMKIDSLKMNEQLMNQKINEIEAAIIIVTELLVLLEGEKATT